MTAPLIVDADGGAALLDVSPRAFADLRKREGFPPPVALFGPRNPRWRVAELVRWVESLPPLKSMDAPLQLIDGKRRKRSEHAQATLAREGLNKSWMMRAGSESRRESRRRAA